MQKLMSEGYIYMYTAVLEDGNKKLYLVHFELAHKNFNNFRQE